MFSFARLLFLPLSAATLAATCNVGSAQIVSESPADKLIEAGHYRRAEAAVRAALSHAPSDAHLLSDLSVIDWAFNRFDSAIANGEKAVAAAPRSPEAHSKLADALGAKLLSSNAGTFEKISLAHRFRKEIDATLELDPNDADALQDLAQFYWEAPGFVGGDKSKARQTADKLFTISPLQAASARIGFLPEDSNTAHRNAAVIAIWRNAAAARPDGYDIRAALAAAALEDTADPNHLATAESEAKRARTLDPTRIRAWTTLATLYAATARWEDLAATIKQAQASVPDDRTPQYRAAVAILTGNHTAQLTLAESYLRDYLAHPPEAQSPSHAGAHWRLGLVLEKEGRKPEAIQEIRTAVQMDSSLDAAKKDLKRLS